MVLGQGKYSYSLTSQWGKLPLWWKFHNCSDIVMDSHDRVYLLDRGPHPILVFDREGNFLSSWGEGMFRSPHYMCIDKEDSIYVADFMTHVVTKFSCDGRVLMTLGTRDVAGESYYGVPFNMPSGVAVAPNGNIFVSDGYGNYKVQKFSPKGEHLGSWGKVGSGPGEFSVLHGINVDAQGRVYVCDRENARMQIFDENGKFLTQWTGMHPSDIHFQDDVAFVVEEGSTLGPPRITVFSLEGQVLSRWGREQEGKDLIFSPHGIWVDSRGVIFVAQIAEKPGDDTRVYFFTPAR